MRALVHCLASPPLLDVADQSDVITRRGLYRLERVDESLRRHRARRRKFMTNGNAPDFETATLAACNTRSFCVGRSRSGLRNLRSPPSPLRGYGATTFAWLADDRT